MNKITLISLAVVLGVASLTGFAFTCPDPETSSLKWGVPPPPWEINPFSAHEPQGEDNTRFVRANILVAGLGRGVVCTYRFSIGDYSIWWPTLTKIPAREEANWINTLGGYICTQGLTECQFTAVVE